MSPITNCPDCGRAYEASSEESANDPTRQCWMCRQNDRNCDAWRTREPRTESPE